jgi:hypothetical protein
MQLLDPTPQALFVSTLTPSHSLYICFSKSLHVFHIDWEINAKSSNYKPFASWLLDYYQTQYY